MKDPAFLFYSSDFLSGTMLMTDEEIGQYIKLLCLQHQKGHLKEKDMLNICKSYDEDIFSKFKKDDEGNYYNERLEEEIIRRKNYSESRRRNRLKKDLEENKETYEKDMNNICNSYEKHMETETETINKNININNNINNNINIKEKNKKEKHKYGEYQNVLLKDEEYDKLKQEYSNYEEIIKFLDEYIEMKGYKAKSHYLCIKKWVADAVEEEYNKGKPRKKEIDGSNVDRFFEKMQQTGGAIYDAV